MTDALFDAPPPTPSSSPVHAAYSNAIAELRKLNVLRPEHEGLAANLLRLGEIIDRERKGYAVAHATAQAHDLMKTLLALVTEEQTDAFDAFTAELARAHPRPSS